jgi:hypothetical protein
VRLYVFEAEVFGEGPRHRVEPGKR